MNTAIRLPRSLGSCISQLSTKTLSQYGATIRSHSKAITRNQHIKAIAPACHHIAVQNRSFCSTLPARYASRPPKSKDRGPVSKEDTQTDFAAMNILGNTPAPTTGIDACQVDGFQLNNGKVVVGSGVLLIGGESFRWSPWIRDGRREGTTSDNNKGVKGQGVRLINSKGQFEVDDHSWGVLEVVWPKPDLLILGTGPSIAPVSPATRKRINDLGIRLEVQDTRNAASQFNLLATERGIQQVAAALVPIGWRDGQ